MQAIPANPDIIFYNANLYRPAKPEATALAVHNGYILALGSDDDVLPLAGPDTRKIDCRGRLLLPGLTDSHVHMSTYAARKLQVSLDDCHTLDAALARIRESVAKWPPGTWVFGGGWDKNRWAIDGFPTKHHLDDISNQHFIALQSKDWHSLWVNTLTLQACGISDLSMNPDGGVIYRMPDTREPSGILQENACKMVLQNIPPMTHEALEPPLMETFAEYHRFGVTAVHSVETPYDFACYSRLFNERRLGLRVFWYFPDQYLEGAEAQQFSVPAGNHFLKICGVKMFSDGALGSQTADMLAPYDGLDHSGVEAMSTEELEHKIRLAIEQKWSCAIHAIGDRANRRVLSVFEQFASASHALDLRHRIEHAQLLSPEDIDRFAANRITASVQPIHLAGDIPTIRRYWQGERERYAYAFNSLIKSGARLIYGSDTPIESFDPWRAIYTALQRKEGCRPEETSFYPEEKVTLEQSLDAYTSESAWVVKEENLLGKLEAGYCADLCLLDRDLTEEADDALLDVQVDYTVSDGKIVYQRVD